jgi:hypothetical protein
VISRNKTFCLMIARRVELYRKGLHEKKVYCGDAVWVMYSELASCIAFSPERKMEPVYFDRSDED